MTYNAIKLAAYQPTGEIPWPVHIMRVPAELRAALEELYRSGLPEHLAKSTRTFPIRSLNALLPLAAPDVLSVGRRVSIEDDVPWLYSLQPVDADLIRDLIGIWSLGLKGDAACREEADRVLDEVPLAWEERPLDLAQAAVGPGGTAEPADHVYPLLTAFIARQIRLKADLSSGNGDRLAFMESPWRGRAAELVSWPPRQGLPEEPDSWFSYVIVLSVQTLPFQPTFRIHVRTGVRRWVTSTGSQGLVYTAGRSVSVYLATTTAWPGMADVRSRLAVHRLRYDAKAAQHVWHSIDQHELLPHASLIRSPVDAADLSADPLKHLTGSGEVRAAIPYSTSMGRHTVGAGLMAGDRVPFLEGIDQVVSEVLERVGARCRVELPDRPTNHQSRPTFSTKLSKEERDRRSEEEKSRRKAEAAQTRRAALRSVLSSGTFTARVLWQDPATRDALVQGLCDVLGLMPMDASEAETLRWSTSEIEVVLGLACSGDLCGGLDVDVNRPSRANVDQAVQARRTAAALTFRHSAADAAVVEIDRVFKSAHLDPKFAIRLGSADAGVLTQFVQTAEQGSALAKNRSHRAQQAWLDLLRQLGAARLPLPPLYDRFGGDIQFIAVWAVNRQRRSLINSRLWRPIAIKYQPRSTQPITGWRDDIRQWTPYREFLLWLAQDAQAGTPDDDLEESEGEPEGQRTGRWRLEDRQRETMSFIRPLLSAQRGRPTVLLVHAQNLRSDWPWISNTNLIPDRLDAGDGEDVPVALWDAGLRVVRVRDSQRDATPQHYGADGNHGLPMGLWRELSIPENRLYYSTGERAATGSNAAIGARREGVRVTASKREIIDTGTPAYNPNLLEICVTACQEGDEPAELASLAHQLRYAPELDKWLTLPYPLHLAMKAAEYATPIAAD
ncbi:DUF3962 domain-containing protein [Nonomuraea sp. NPDC049637]|uniref:pPIWI_RE module domain-containing protein n=1 Tax=Nonomuraea sp. NPDC049637 TaxID=3154356 RepID=UPI00341F566D